MKTLYIAQKVLKVKDRYPIVDKEGTPIYRVDQDFTWVGRKVRVTTPDGDPVFTIERDILRVLPHYDVSFEDGRTLSIKSRFKMFRVKLEILPEALGLTVSGNIMRDAFDIMRHEKCVAHITRQTVSMRDVFILEILADDMTEACIAVTVAVDDILNSRRNN